MGRERQHLGCDVPRCLPREISDSGNVFQMLRRGITMFVTALLSDSSIGLQAVWHGIRMSMKIFKARAAVRVFGAMGATLVNVRVPARVGDCRRDATMVFRRFPGVFGRLWRYSAPGAPRECAVRY